jgi:hypothetical protein
MKTLILIATLVLTAAVTIAQDDPKKEATKVVVNLEMVKRFNECQYDSTKNFRYIMAQMNKPVAKTYDNPAPAEQKNLAKK